MVGLRAERGISAIRDLIFIVMPARTLDKKPSKAEGIIMPQVRHVKGFLARFSRKMREFRGKAADGPRARRATQRPTTHAHRGGGKPLDFAKRFR